MDKKLPKRIGKHILYRPEDEIADVVNIEKDKVGFYWADFGHKNRPVVGEFYIYVGDCVA